MVFKKTAHKRENKPSSRAENNSSNQGGCFNFVYEFPIILFSLDELSTAYSYKQYHLSDEKSFSFFLLHSTQTTPVHKLLKKHQPTDFMLVTKMAISKRFLFSKPDSPIISNHLKKKKKKKKKKNEETK